MNTTGIRLIDIIYRHTESFSFLLFFDTRCSCCTRYFMREIRKERFLIQLYETMEFKLNVFCK